MKDIVILTGGELRHDFVRMAFGAADGINVLASYCETSENRIIDIARQEESAVQADHLKARARSEQDFFQPFVELVNDRSKSTHIPAGAINEEQYYEEITSLDPDLLVTYGCSLIEDPLLSAYERRFPNVHLGLSPYYRGTGTNFWPLVNREPEYVGATFMHIDEGVDTGDIIHQLRARIYPGDSPHQIGNRLIADMTQVYIELVRQFDSLDPQSEPEEPADAKYYKRADYSTEATEQLYENFEDGMIETYLENRTERNAAVPIVTNERLDGVLSTYDPFERIEHR